MPKFIFAYHGGKMPESEEEGAKVMAAWGAWIGGLGDAFVTPGAPVGMSKTVSASGVEDNGGSNPISGYSVVMADNMDAAIEIAKGCPGLANESTVEVAELIEM